MASSSDKFIKTVQAPPSKLAGPIGPDTETIPLQTLEGWSSTTAVVVAIDRYDDATGEITPSKTEIVVGTLGPNGLENVERGVGGTRQNHSDGAVAEISIAAGEQWNRAMDALIGALGQDGKIKGEMIVPGSVGPGAFKKDSIEALDTTFTTYSTTEKIVGMWIDEKPIYRKTIDFGALPNNAEKKVNHNVEGVDKIVGVEPIYLYSGTYVQGARTASTFLVWNVSTTHIICTNNTNMSAGSATVTLRYTKI